MIVWCMSVDKICRVKVKICQLSLVFSLEDVNFWPAFGGVLGDKAFTAIQLLVDHW